MHEEFSVCVDRENAVIMPSFLYTRRVCVLPVVDIVKPSSRNPRILVVHSIMCTPAWPLFLSGLLDTLRSSVQWTFFPGLAFGHLFAGLLVFEGVSLKNC